MKPSDGESRRLKRSEAQQVVLVRDVFRDLDVGRIVNLHEEGFMIICGDQVKENGLYQMQLVFAEAVDGCTQISVGAECLWIKETVGDERFWAGFHIMDIASEDVAILTKLKSQVDNS